MVTLPIWAEVEMAFAIWGVLPSRMRLRMAELTTMTSHASERPSPEALGRSCWATTARSVIESCMRIWAWRASGKTSTRRSIESAADCVCRVPNTRCPVSAAVRAHSMVSRSRISPTRMTSGSSRRIARRPAAKLSVWRPTSRWLTRASSDS